MGKWIRRIVMLLLLIVFLGSGGMVLSILHQYRVSEALYEDAAKEFVRMPDDSFNGGDGIGTPDPSGDDADSSVSSSEYVSAEVSQQEVPVGEIAPFVVDFEALLKKSPDVVGWIYCPGTIINYPVVQAADDNYYLHRSYDGSYNFAGSIFVEAVNKPEFQDPNTIIYGHNMKDNTMFAGLSKWSSQSFYDQHPTIWLMTPEQDYRIELFSGYTTSAGSYSYTLFQGPGEELDEYIGTAIRKSDFDAGFAPQQGERLVLLSTCAYVFDNARYVLHGVLRPLSSAGGVPIVR